MAKIKGTVVVDTERCKGCDLCTGLPSECFGVGRKSKLQRVPLCNNGK